MTDTLFIHQINDAKTIISDAKTIINDTKTIINYVYKEYQKLIAKHLVEIIKKSKNQIINERNQILSTIRTQEVKTCFVFLLFKCMPVLLHISLAHYASHLFF